ncbi:DUF2076 family protein [Comamonas sp.]|uniref:DUF2076 family protein n=1 Tax=Comamonas sp. TaxID=34028 RepID=UPI003A902AD5
MTSQEQQLLRELFERLAQTRGAPKDAQAEAEIRQGLAAVPDAAYWLAQRSLLLENALQQAQQQISQLQQEVDQGRQAAARTSGAGSFLSGGLDTHFGRGPLPAYESPQAAPAAQPAPSWRDRFFGGSAPAAQAAPSAAGGFLGTAAASAAGVAGGMLLFNGLGNLLGQHEAQSHSDKLQDEAQGSHQSLQSEKSVPDQMARDAGVDSIDSAASGNWDDGGSWDDDSFA